MPSSTRALSIGESAWLALLPCALAVLAATVFLGPPLGRLLLAPGGAGDFWRHYVVTDVVRPEPTEHARYLLALAGPLLLAGCAVALARRAPPRDAALAWLTALSRVTLIVFVLVCIVYQRRLVYDASYTGQPFKTVYFTVPTLVVALTSALLSAVALGHAPTRRRLETAAREAPGRRVAALAVAALFSGAWLLSAFNTDGSLQTVNGSVSGNVPFWTDEAFSILNGHAPLVDFHAQYGQLWAYLAAAVMSVVGTSFAVYAATMLAGTAVALLALLGTLRKLARGTMAAVALFLPIAATGFFMEAGPLDNRYGPANLFSLFPIRYAGPYVLLWLVVRRIRRAQAMPPVALFAFAGLVAINNVEFGVPALVAAVLALSLASPERSPRAILRLAAGAAAGLACSLLLVGTMTLVVAGSLPDLGMLATFPQIYGAEGFGLLPAPTLGLHLVVYLTFSAALVLALLRSRADDPALTAALAWAGTFGLGAGAYFMGRSHPHVLIDLFSAWSLTIALLVVVVAQASSRQATRRPTAVELLVLTGFGIAVCSLAQTPTPWSQVARLQDAPSASSPLLVRNATRQVLTGMTKPGEPVAILLSEGHRIATDIGVDDVTPYANLESMLTVGQWRETIAALRAAHGRKLIVPRARLLDEQVRWLERAGYAATDEAVNLGIVEFVERP